MQCKTLGIPKFYIGHNHHLMLIKPSYSLPSPLTDMGSVQAGCRTELMGRDTRFTIGYQGTDEAMPLPETLYLGSVYSGEYQPRPGVCP
jgi:hypothetical protein